MAGPPGIHLQLALELDSAAFQRVTQRLELVGLDVLLIYDRLLIFCDLALAFDEIETILRLVQALRVRPPGAIGF